ncbi:hypothetical protein FALBO_5973, partial [Fusarium albosuccineum]
MGLSADTRSILPPWHDTSIKAQLPSTHNHGDPSSSQLEQGFQILSPEMGVRRVFTTKTMPLALALPWVATMILSWVPFCKIGLVEAPYFVTMAAVVSTIELLSIIAVFIYTSISPEAFSVEPAEPGRSTTWQEKFFRAWFWFLFISPFVTSALVVILVSDISCDEEDDLAMNQPICQVGVRLIKATALCRV